MSAFYAWRITHGYVWSVGIKIGGVKAQAMPGQWAFQIGPSTVRLIFTLVYTYTYSYVHVYMCRYVLTCIYTHKART